MEKLELIDLSCLARRLDIPYRRASAFVADGVFVADANYGSKRLFLESRLAELAMAASRAETETALPPLSTLKGLAAV